MKKNKMQAWIKIHLGLIVVVVVVRFFFFLFCINLILTRKLEKFTIKISNKLLFLSKNIFSSIRFLNMFIAKQKSILNKGLDLV